MFANFKNSWSTRTMKNVGFSVKEKLVAKYLEKDQKNVQPKSSDINVLLNRIKLNKKSEKRKKIYFSAAASTGLILFGLIIF
jgi:hypothetical protein